MSGAHWATAILMVGMLSLAALDLPGCAMVKPVIRAVDDIARDACQLFATGHPDQLGGVSPAEFCDAREHLEPFIDHILSGQQAAGAAAVSATP